MASLPKFKNEGSNNRSGRDENAELWQLLRQSQLRVSKYKKKASLLGDDIPEEEEKKIESIDNRDIDKEKDETLNLLRLSRHRYSVGSYQDMPDEDKDALDNIPELDLDLKVFSDSEDDDTKGTNDEDVSDFEEYNSEEELKKSAKSKPKKTTKKKKKRSKSIDETEDGDKPKKIVRNRVEKKNKKMMSKLGLKRIKGVARATFKSKRGVFFIDDPDVYQEPSDKRGRTGELVIFGQTFIQETPYDAFDQTLAQNLQDVQRVMEEAQAAKNEDGTFHTLPTTINKEKKLSILSEQDYIDEKGLDTVDIELVMSQASVSRKRAVNALRKNNKDVVDSIMWLQS